MQRRLTRIGAYRALLLRATLVVLAGGCSGGKPADRAAVAGGAANVNASPTDPPPTLGISDDILTADMGNGTKVADFVRAHQAEFGAPQDASIATLEGENPCIFKIAVANRSHNIKKMNAKHDWYAVALISNPNNCGAANNFYLDGGQTAAWLVSYHENTPATTQSDGSQVGAARLVVVDLSPPQAGTKPSPDMEVPQSADNSSAPQVWRLGYCANDSKPTSHQLGDLAFVMFKAGICDIPDSLGHDEAQVASYMATQYAKIQSATKSLKTLDDFDSDDPAFWFACGADCCYADADNSSAATRAAARAAARAKVRPKAKSS